MAKPVVRKSIAARHTGIVLVVMKSLIASFFTWRQTTVAFRRLMIGFCIKVYLT
jgi:hypothetical protein